MVCRMRNCVNVCLTGEHLLKFQNFAQFPKYTKCLYYVIRATINWTLPGGYRTLVNIMQWIMHTSYSTIKRNRLNDDLPRWQCYLCSCLSLALSLSLSLSLYHYKQLHSVKGVAPQPCQTIFNSTFLFEF